jgi:hypothetical protein
MNMLIEQQPSQTTQIAIAQSNQAIALAGAVLDKRIATARQWPRSISRFKQEAIGLLQNDIDTAMSAEYSKPVGGGSVRGPSVRLAELACLCWGNIEVEIAEPIVSEVSVTVTAYAWDLEKNIRVPGIATASILTKAGARYPQHMVETTVIAVASKARRNAILAAIPRTYINDLLEAAKEVASKHSKPLEQVRSEMAAFFARSYNVQLEQLLEYLQVKGLEDITTENVEELRAVVAALKEGESPEAYFGQAKSKSELAKEKVAARRDKANQPESEQAK